MMFFLALLMIAVCICLPLGYAWRLVRLDAPTKAAWLVAALEAALVTALVMIVGRWDMAGYHVRFAVLAVVLLAFIASLARHARRPWLSADAPFAARHGLRIATIGLLSAALGYAGSGMIMRPEPRQLAFPLVDGRFMVAQGGGNVILNHHAGHPEQRHAADIVAINSFGFRAAGLAPRDVRAYEAYGATVVSPCDGTVIAARRTLDDLAPPRRDADNPAGNGVIVDCGGFRVELAHLQRGSTSVAPGDRVTSGQPVGAVGNSGNTTEPHLHIHAFDPVAGTGVPMSFDGISPVRNRIFTN